MPSESTVLRSARGGRDRPGAPRRSGPSERLGGGGGSLAAGAGGLGGRPLWCDSSESVAFVAEDEVDPTAAAASPPFGSSTGAEWGLRGGPGSELRRSMAGPAVLLAKPPWIAPPSGGGGERGGETEGSALREACRPVDCGRAGGATAGSEDGGRKVRRGEELIRSELRGEGR